MKEVLSRLAPAAASLVLIASLGAPGCGGGSGVGAPHEQHCRLNSDCPSDRFCADGVCTLECREDRDCTTGERCAAGRCTAITDGGTQADGSDAAGRDGGEPPNNEPILRGETVCGPNNWIDPTTLGERDPQRLAGRAVGLLLIGGFRCSGFLIDNRHLVTNYHCACSPGQRVEAVFGFMPGTNLTTLRRNAQNRFWCTLASDGGTLFRDPLYDVAVLNCDANPGVGYPGETWGFLRLETRVPAMNDPIYVIHQNCDEVEVPGCDGRADWTQRISPGRVVSARGGRTGGDPGEMCGDPTGQADKSFSHDADTLGGSSGGPALASESHRVIGINFGGNVEAGMDVHTPTCSADGYRNVAIRMTSICNELPWFRGLDVCEGCAVRNACGGCDALPGRVGDACGACGRLVCDGPERLTCSDPGRNACGGCSSLSNAPGTSCGMCGHYECNGLDTVRCMEGAGNACGGCAMLPNPPATPCGTCGAYACSGDNSTRCAGDHSRNACGGCANILNTPGASCGRCGHYECDGLDAVRCAEGAGNACGGCIALAAAPGTPCGTCGTYVCQGTDTVRCSDHAPNACGGCSSLANAPGSACGACGMYECSGADATRCADRPRNACDGCAVLSNAPGAPCGRCGMYACDGTDAVRCVEGMINACGMCGPTPPEICDGLDNDCDGAADEDFTCRRGASRSCVTSCGTPGNQTCNASCSWDTCTGPGICAPRATRCSADGRSVEQCSADGCRWTSVMSCGCGCGGGSCAASCPFSLNTHYEVRNDGRMYATPTYLGPRAGAGVIEAATAGADVRWEASDARCGGARGSVWQLWRTSQGFVSFCLTLDASVASVSSATVRAYLRGQHDIIGNRASGYNWTQGGSVASPGRPDPAGAICVDETCSYPATSPFSFSVSPGIRRCVTIWSLGGCGALDAQDIWLDAVDMSISGIQRP